MQCWTPIGHFRLIFLYNYTFYSCYNMVWIANTEIGPKQQCYKEVVVYLLFFSLILSAYGGGAFSREMTTNSAP